MGVRRATVDDAEAIENIRVETWRATYRGLLPDGLIDQLQPNVESRRDRLRSSGPLNLTFVAEDGTVGIEPLSTAEGADRLRRALTRLKRGEPAKFDSPAFGLMSHDDRVQLNLRHAELHFSFLRLR